MEERCINPLTLRINSNDDDIDNNKNNDQRKFTPLEIVNDNLSKDFNVNDNVITICSTLWPDQDFIQDIKTNILEKEMNCEFITKESLIMYYDNIKGDRIKDLSTWYHKILIFLTYKPVNIAMHISFIVAVCTDIVYICNGSLIVIPLLTASTIMYIVYSSFLSKLLVGCRTGILYDLSKLNTWNWNPFKYNAASYQFLTGYEIIDSIIVFNLSKKSDIHITYWKAVEERSNLNIFRKQIYFGLFLSLIVFPTINIYLFAVIPIMNCITGVWFCNGFIVIRHIALLTFWLIFSTIMIQIFVMNLLTISTHFFQVEVFKTRLEIDRSKRNDGQWKSQRHLIEEYLYHQELFSASTKIWQGLLFFTLLYSFILVFVCCAISLFIASVDVVLSSLFLFYTIFDAIIFLVLLFLPAQLNSSRSEIINILTKGADSDWELYGRRKELLEYFQSNPLEYTTYNFAITYS